MPLFSPENKNKLIGGLIGVFLLAAGLWVKGCFSAAQPIINNNGNLVINPSNSPITQNYNTPQNLPPRILNNQDKAILDTISVTEVPIMTEMDSETFDYAKQIGNYLASKGHHVTITPTGMLLDTIQKNGSRFYIKNPDQILVWHQ